MKTEIEISTKSKLELLDILSKIENSTFEDSDIKDLFILTRPFADKNSLVFDIASFIAHKEGKDRGDFHSIIDGTYASLRYTIMNPDNAKIDFKKIEAQLFEALTQSRLKLYTDDELKKMFNKNSSALISLIKDTYKKVNGYYIINKENNINSILSIINKLNSSFESNRARIKNDLLINQWNLIINNLISKYNMKISHNILLKHKEDIIVCVICILNTEIVHLHDNNKAELTMVVTETTNQKCLISLGADLDFGRILMTGPTGFSFSILNIQVNSNKYINNTELFISYQKYMYTTLFKTKRDNHKNLKLLRTLINKY